jgi:hypothetical protein
VGFQPVAVGAWRDHGGAHRRQGTAFVGGDGQHAAMHQAEPGARAALAAPGVHRGHELRRHLDQVEAVLARERLQQRQQRFRRGGGQEGTRSIPVGADAPLERRYAEQVLVAQRRGSLQVAQARGSSRRRHLPQAHQVVGQDDGQRPTARIGFPQQRAQSTGQRIRGAGLHRLLCQHLGARARPATHAHQGQAVGGDAQAQGLSETPTHARSPA